MSVAFPALTAVLAFVMAIALLDQWRDRRQPFQLVWAIGMTFFGNTKHHKRGLSILEGQNGDVHQVHITFY